MSTKLGWSRDLLAGGPLAMVKRGTHLALENTTIGAPLRFKLSERQIRRRKTAESSLEDILDTVLTVRPGVPPYELFAMQIRSELRSLAEMLADRDIRTVLEIGTAKGGTLYTWVRHLDSVSGVVSVDLPGGEFGGGYDQRSTALFQGFDRSTEMAFVRDDSQEVSTFDRVATAVSERMPTGEVDFLFIDGDHTYDGVRRDFELYSDLVGESGVIALHDIVVHPNREHVVEQRRRNYPELDDKKLRWDPSYERCNVSEFWDEIREEYSTTELISDERQAWGGIGIVHL